MVKSKLSKQIAIYVSIIIFAIEGIVFAFSYYSKKEELKELHRVLEEDIVAITGKNFDDLHPGILDKEDISLRLNIFSKNILILVIIIASTTSLGVLLVINFLAIKRLKKMKLSNLNIKERVTRKDLIILNTLPNDEIDELINSRNQMIEKIIVYQDDVESKIKELEGQIVQSAKLSAIGEMTASLIHDLKNPLTSLDLHTQQLNYQNKIEDVKYEKMAKSIHQITNLVERMGRFSRQSTFDKEILKIKNIIQESISFVDSKALKAQVTIDATEVIDTSIFGDPIALQQVFTNLISNAIDAVEDSEIRRIQIKSHFAGDNFIVDIIDSGIGMSEETQRSIFQSFFTTKPIGKGTGLGLSSVKRILNEHEVEISVESQLNLGTQFSLLFKVEKV